MLRHLASLLPRDGLPPHGASLAGAPWLIWAHIAGDSAILLSYAAISLALISVMRQRRDLIFKPILLPAIGFILLCGTAGLLDAATLWLPLHQIAGWLVLVTAAIASTTSVALWRLIPKLLALPSRHDLEAANKALTASEAGFRVLAEQTAGVISRFGPDGRLRYVSPASAEFFGLSPKALLENGAAKLMVGDDLAQLRRQLRELIHTDREELVVEYRIQHPRKGQRWIETTARQVRDERNGASDGLIAMSRDITERKAEAERISHLAHHDPLTDLPNRSLFNRRLADALALRRDGEHIAVCYLDLDNFKPVNDTLGHAHGDILLRAAALRLAASIRPDDFVARLGGDEFAVVSTRLDGEGDAAALAQRLAAAIAEPFDLAGHRAVIGTSVGIAMAPAHGLTAELLLCRADLALYSAKQRRRGSWQVFSADMQTRREVLHSLESDLRQSLIDGDFEVHYQPIVSLPTGGVLGFEALLRWRHKARGMLLPAEFIELAESSGLIVPLGEWVLRRACSDAAGWAADLRLSVNLSALQFCSATLADDVSEILARAGLPPQRLVLEVTEPVISRNPEASHETLRRLGAMGVSVALDDFGTGGSSFGVLRRHRFETVKIDRSSIRTFGCSSADTALVHAAIDLARNLGIPVTAEGVESRQHALALAAMGCDRAQGYHFGRPAPFEQILPLVRPPALPPALSLTREPAPGRAGVTQIVAAG